MPVDIQEPVVAQGIDLAMLAKIANSRSEDQGLAKPLHEAGLLRYARDGWVSLSMLGSKTLSQAGYLPQGAVDGCAPRKGLGLVDAERASLSTFYRADAISKLDARCFARTHEWLAAQGYAQSDDQEPEGGEAPAPRPTCS